MKGNLMLSPKIISDCPGKQFLERAEVCYLCSPGTRGRSALSFVDNGIRLVGLRQRGRTPNYMKFDAENMTLKMGYCKSIVKSLIFL